MCVFACMKTKVCAKLTRTKAQEQRAMAFTAWLEMALFKSITQYRKTFIIQPKHMVFC